MSSNAEFRDRIRSKSALIADALTDTPENMPFWTVNEQTGFDFAACVSLTLVAVHSALINGQPRSAGIPATRLPLLVPVVLVQRRTRPKS
jgi:hypothetical protein